MSGREVFDDPDVRGARFAVMKDYLVGGLGPGRAPGGLLNQLLLKSHQGHEVILERRLSSGSVWIEKWKCSCLEGWTLDSSATLLAFQYPSDPEIRIPDRNESADPFSDGLGKIRELNVGDASRPAEALPGLLEALDQGNVAGLVVAMIHPDGKISYRICGDVNGQQLGFIGLTLSRQATDGGP